MNFMKNIKSAHIRVNEKSLQILPNFNPCQSTFFIPIINDCLLVFMMPTNRAFDVFLLEPGTKLSLISQSIVQPQPSLTISHDTQLFITKKITKTSDKTCQKITMSEKMDCIIDKIREDLLSNGITCLPFYYHSVFTKLHSEFSLCQDNTTFRYTNKCNTVRNNPNNIKLLVTT